MQPCPYQDKPSLHQLPCNYNPHPERQHIYFCSACQNSYDVREINDSKFSSWLLFSVLGLILMLIIGTGGIAEFTPNIPEPTTSSQPYSQE